MAELSVSMCRAPFPALRAAVFAAVGTLLGVSAHHLVAAGPVPWRRSAAAAVVFFTVGFLGARRPRSVAAVIGTSAAAQAGLHLWLTAAHGHGTMPADAPAPVHAHPGADVHGIWHERLHEPVAMTAVHALVAVFVAVLLQRADAACWALARGVHTALAAARERIAATRGLWGGRPSPTCSSVPQPRTPWWDLPPPTGTVLTDVVTRRGLPPGRARSRHPLNLPSVSEGRRPSRAHVCLETRHLCPVLLFRESTARCGVCPWPAPWPPPLSC